MKQARVWAIAAGLLVAFVVDRWGIHLSSGHLLFHIDGAEYFYLRALGPFSERSTFSLLTDYHDRRFFLRSLVQVADLAFHGSTMLPGIVLHWLYDKLGVSWSTSSLKGVALAYAALGMATWMLLLGWLWRSPGAAWRFGALALLGPAVYVKLNLLHWGTHEQVMLWHAVLLLATGVWLRRPGGDPGTSDIIRASLRSVVLGGLCALLALVNYSLLLPGFFTLAWITIRDAHAHGKDRGRWVVVSASTAALLAGVGAFLLGLWLLDQIDLLEAVGFTAALWRDDKMEEAMALPAFHGPWDAIRSAPVGTWSLLPGVVVAAVVLGSRWVKRNKPAPSAHLLFLSSYLLAAWMAIAILPVAYDELGVWRPRFSAHLWPVSFAVIACWSAQRGDWLRRGVLLAVLAAGLPVQWALLDPANMSAGSRYDGARLFELTFDEAGAIPEDRMRLKGVSGDFLVGFGVLRSYQSIEYWCWTPPRRAARLDHAAILMNYPGAPGLPDPGTSATGVHGSKSRLDAALAAEDVDPAEFFRGVGYAYRVLLPPRRSKHLDDLLDAFPERRNELLSGYTSDVLP